MLYVRMSNYSIFADIDLKNEFHQARITEQTSRMLTRTLVEFILQINVGKD